ncbi:hypothetical protein NKI54_15735 [Mesorhizobium sp. M0663]|uniref:hypothetical protein n=1 Tax=unclassified Mesorhizobium TaxID=325217 RepID=UPI0033389AA0
MKRNVAFSMLAAGLLSACNPLAAQQPKDQIVGRWESPTWTRNEVPLFAQFSADGRVQYMDSMGTTGRAEWMFLESGDLQLTYPAGLSRRCTVGFDQSKNMKLTPPTCLYGWDDMGESVVLAKQ